MPEGDTIHRVATRLRPALEGRRLVAFDAPRLVGPRPEPGQLVTAVESAGKHLLICFDDDLELRVHLGMSGSWHLYERGQRWRRPRHLARVVLTVDDWQAVCFSAPTVRSRRGDAPSPVDRLGPDLCRPDPDLDRAVARMASVPEPATSVAEVLLDQRVAAGIGNVYKSEVLHLCGVDPFASIESIDEDTRRHLLATAARLLAANLGGGPRATVPGGLAVYGRRGSPCRSCGTPIEMRRHGVASRSTYWCPTCQPGT